MALRGVVRCLQEELWRTLRSHSSGVTPFLGVFSQGASGTGWDSEHEYLFDLSLPDFKPIFGFTTYGWAVTLGQLERTIHSRIFADGNTISLMAEVHFAAGNFDLGAENYTATYTRRPGEKQFSFQQVRPNLSEQDFDELVNLVEDRPANERLLLYTLPGLKELASSSDAEARDWLRFVLDRCKDTPEKRELEALLDKKR